MKQMIISVGREFGSGGHQIADALADHYKLPLYDRNLLEEVARERNLEQSGMSYYDERRPSGLLISGSPENQVAQLQFDFLTEKANRGDSFVVVGRCAENLLRGRKELISIFVHADMDTKVQRIMERNYMTRVEAEEFIKQQDKRRRDYHNVYCSMKWGDAGNYDISVNSSCMGIDKTVEFLIGYITQRREILDQEERAAEPEK